MIVLFWHLLDPISENHAPLTVVAQFTPLITVTAVISQHRFLFLFIFSFYFYLTGSADVNNVVLN